MFCLKEILSKRLATNNSSSILISILYLVELIDKSCEIHTRSNYRRVGRPYVYSTTTIFLRCFIVRIWFRLDSNRSLHHYLSIDLPYNRKVKKACGLSEFQLPNRRTFDRRLKTISIDIKERIIATMGHLFVIDGIVKPYIIAIDSTLLLSRLEVMYGTNHP